MTLSGPDNFVLYDGECPVCASYMAVAELRVLHPDLQVLDARSHPALVARMRALGHDVNAGIIVKTGARIHGGAAATRLIAELGSRHAWVRRTALRVISGGPFGETIYPYQRACRNFLLRILGRSQIG